MKFKAYFKPIEFEADTVEEAHEFVNSGDYYDDVECNLIEEIK